jgi:hypothetical protein
MSAYLIPIKLHKISIETDLRFIGIYIAAWACMYNVVTGEWGHAGVGDEAPGWARVMVCRL